MPKVKAAPVDQLRTLNELLGRVSDPERAEHARRALEFAYQEHPEDLEHMPLGDYVDKLARLHFGEIGEGVEFAFAHWHVPRLEDFSPLWIRQAIVVEMKKLAGRREGLLLVTGLREAVCPAGKYWTKQREFQYQRVRDWIDELACAWATKGSRLQVVVL
ncbi:MAG: hypothetical protein ACI9ZV_000693 [Candidatus Azotimanducaceae bacterium]|jgi:hypothetical protein